MIVVRVACSYFVCLSRWFLDISYVLRFDDFLMILNLGKALLSVQKLTDDMHNEIKKGE
jgi:hypothetical protein